MNDLTTTSYAVLGLLSIRPHSAYDLTQQARRSLRFIWPTSESQLYAEPKRLARKRLIRVSDQAAGGSRTRTVYRITPSGRRTLEEWLHTTPPAPHTESEVLLRALFADGVDTTTLIDTLRECRDRTLEEYQAGAALIESYAAADGPYPERIHMNALWWAFVNDFFLLALDWFEFAEREIATWKDTAHGGSPARSQAIVDTILSRNRVLR